MSDLERQIAQCREIVDSFIVELKQTAKSEILRLPEDMADIDAIISQVNIDVPIGCIDINTRSCAALLSDACTLLCHALNALESQDFGTFATLLFQATSYQTKVLVTIGEEKKLDIANEQTYMYAESIPKIIKSAHKSVAKSGGNTRKQNDKDGKQAALSEIYFEWLYWKKEPASSYGNIKNAKFARQMIEKFKATDRDGVEEELALETVTKAIRKWEAQEAKEAEAIKN